jgi:hypothetical protein
LRILRSLALLGLAVLATTLAAAPSFGASPKLPPLTPAPADGLSRALTDGRVTPAVYALERALALFQPSVVRARYGPVERLRPEAATFVLRDLAARVHELGPAERKQARSILARPTDEEADPNQDGWDVAEAAASPVCVPRYCVHWVSTTADAPPSADGDANGVPDWIETTVKITRRVFAKEVDDLNFPRPKNDTSSNSQTDPSGNPTGALDIYLADIGRVGLYGYCATDDPNAFNFNYRWWDVSAYCVLDDDFRPLQFPIGANGQNANRVTIAHEVHHAEQFALDWLEDIWIMEAGATTMERVVFPGIHDNHQYLATSPITQPGIPLDRSDPSAGNVYGDWIFFQYLAEHFGGAGAMRRIWSRLDGRRGRPDQHSIQGVKNFLAAQGRPLRKVFGNFALANRRVRTSYAIGSSFPRLGSPTAERYKLGRRARTRSGAWRSRHLTARWITFRPGGHAPRRGRLRLEVDLPAKVSGPTAKAIVVTRAGARRVRRIPLNAAGNGRLWVRFGRAKIRRVELLLANGGARYRCWTDTLYACRGRAIDDGRVYRFTASLRR